MQINKKFLLTLKFIKNKKKIVQILSKNGLLIKFFERKFKQQKK